MIMMPVFYQTHLKSQLSLAGYLLLKILINILQSIKKVSLETLATRCATRLDFEIQAKGAPIYRFQLHLKAEERKYSDFCHYPP